MGGGESADRKCAVLVVWEVDDGSHTIKAVPCLQEADVKRFAERTPGRHPYKGYLARCSNCGLMVVHARKNNEPFHMHRYSKMCEELGKKRRGEK